MIELVLPMPTPSLNRQFGQHWSKRAKLRKQWAWMVRAEKLRWQKSWLIPGYEPLPISYAKHVPEAEVVEAADCDPAVSRCESGLVPHRVTISRYGPRMLDHDNFVAGAKQLLDALVSEGFLVDDSPQHLQATYRQHVGKPYRTEVRIE